MTIAISSLFQPSPPGINSQNPAGTIAPGSWLATLLADGATLGLPTTAWQPGQPIRTVMAIQAVELAKEDSIISMQAQGGLLDFAATGTVTFTDINGATFTVPVSPDPSIPGQNPMGAPTWLDVLVSSSYNLKRTAAASASGTLYFANIGGSSAGTFNPGTFHTANPVTNVSYSNQVAFTGSVSSVIGGTVTAATAATPVAVTTSAAHGLTTGAVIFAKGLVVVPDEGATPTPGPGFYQITVTGANSFTLNGSVGTGSYTGTAGRIYSTQAITTAADLVGTIGNSAPGAITQLITSAPNCFVNNLATFAGANWQSNVSLASQARAKLATLSPNGPGGAYLFYALASYLILNGQSLGVSPPNVTTAVANYLTATGASLPNPLPALFSLDGGPITQALVQTSTATGTVTTTLRNSSGVVKGCMNNGITAVTATSPIQVTSANHGLVSGDYVQVNLVGGISGANGTFVCTVLDANNITLNGSTGTGVYTALSGQLSGGDLYAVNQVLQAYCVPNGTTAITQSATPVTVTIKATVYVPNALLITYTTAMQTALTSYLASFPIGGLNVDNASNVLPIGAIEGVLYAAGSVAAGQFYTLSVTGLTLNGVAQDLSLGTIGVAQLPSTNPFAGIVIIGQ